MMLHARLPGGQLLGSGRGNVLPPPRRSGAQSLLLHMPCFQAPLFELQRCRGLLRELNPGPLAPEARIMPLDQAANRGCPRPTVIDQLSKSNRTFNLLSRAVSLKLGHSQEPQGRACEEGDGNRARGKQHTHARSLLRCLGPNGCGEKLVGDKSCPAFFD